MNLKNMFNLLSINFDTYFSIVSGNITTVYENRGGYTKSSMLMIVSTFVFWI